MQLCKNNKSNIKIIIIYNYVSGFKMGTFQYWDLQT